MSRVQDTKFVTCQVNDADGDGDGVPDVTDACPLNPNIRNINFTLHETVKLSTR